MLLDSVTTAPPAGAGPFNVTVPADVPPPNTDVGLRLTDVGDGAVTVKGTLRVEPYVAEMLRAAALATGVVVTVNVAVIAFAATVTFAGTCAAPVLLLDRAITAPPVGAGAVSVTVPVEIVPPTTEAGFTVMEPTVGKEPKFSPVIFPLVTVVLWLGGLKTNPELLGVTV